jgi:hypothetical protein
MSHLNTAGLDLPALKGLLDDALLRHPEARLYVEAQRESIYHGLGVEQIRRALQGIAQAYPNDVATGGAGAGETVIQQPQLSFNAEYHEGRIALHMLDGAKASWQYSNTHLVSLELKLFFCT